MLFMGWKKKIFKLRKEFQLEKRKNVTSCLAEGKPQQCKENLWEYMRVCFLFYRRTIAVFFFFLKVADLSTFLSSKSKVLVPSPESEWVSDCSDQ